MIVSRYVVYVMPCRRANAELAAKTTRNTDAINWVDMTSRGHSGIGRNVPVAMQETESVTRARLPP